MRTLALLATLLVLVGSSSLCSNNTYFTQQTAQRMCRVQQHMWGMGFAKCSRSNDSQQHGALPSTGMLQPMLFRAQGRYNFVLLHGLAMMLMISLTAHLTRSAVTAKVLTDLCDKLSLLLRIALQLAICADLASSVISSPTPAGPHSPTVWAHPVEPAAAAPSSNCSCLCRFTMWNILAGSFLLNHLVLFSKDTSSELFAGLLEALPLCVNLGLYQQCSLSADCSINSSSSSTSGGMLTGTMLVARMFRRGKISSVKVQILAVASRILLPLLVQRLLLPPSPHSHGVQSSSNSSRGVSSVSSVSSGGSDGRNSSRYQLTTPRVAQVAGSGVTASSSSSSATTTNTTATTSRIM